MDSEVFLITGGTSGIGFETAKVLSAKDATLVLAARNPERGAAALERIHQIHPHSQTDFMQLDLSSMGSVRAFAEDFRKRFSRLDVLVNNAGTFLLRRKVSVDGYEMTLAANHLGHFLFTGLLMDLLKSSTPSRVVNVASESHRRARLNFDDLQNEKRYNGMRVYGQSKLANLLFTYELSRRIADHGVTVNAMHPGFVSTHLGRDNGWLIHVFTRLIMLSGGSAAEGAETIIYLADSPEVEGVSGKYYVRKKAVASSAISYDLATARRLWEISAGLTGLTD